MIARSPKFLITVLSLLFVLSAAFIASAQDEAKTCAAVVSGALSELGTNCANLGRNATCYGHEQIAHSAFTETVPADFYSLPGDRADLSRTEAIQTGPFDLAQEFWGLNVMNVVANVPAASSAKGVVYVQFGGVEVENAVDPDRAVQPLASGIEVATAINTDLLTWASVAQEGNALEVVASVPAGSSLSVDAVNPLGNFVRAVFDGQIGYVSVDALDPQVDLTALPTMGPDDLTPMQSFYVRTGIGGIPCADAPSLLFIQGPNNAPADLRLYDQPVRIQSTIIVRLNAAGDQLELIVLSGLAILNAGTPDEIIVPPGYITTIALGPELLSLGIEGDVDDKGAVGTWSPPRPLTEEELAGLETVEDIPGNIINYEVDVPVIVPPSGVGQPLPTLVFQNPEALDQAVLACEAGLLPEDVCAYLGIS